MHQVEPIRTVAFLRSLSMGAPDGPMPLQGDAVAEEHGYKRGDDLHKMGFNSQMVTYYMSM